MCKCVQGQVCTCTPGCKHTRGKRRGFTVGVSTIFGTSLYVGVCVNVPVCKRAYACSPVCTCKMCLVWASLCTLQDGKARRKLRDPVRNCTCENPEAARQRDCVSGSGHVHGCTSSNLLPGTVVQRHRAPTQPSLQAAPSTQGKPGGAWPGHQPRCQPVWSHGCPHMHYINAVGQSHGGQMFRLFLEPNGS